MFKMITGIILALALVACGGTPQREVVTQTVIKVVETPVQMLDSIPVTKPPSTPDAYAVMSCRDKEEALTNYIIDLLKNVNVCNQHIKDIKDFQAKEKANLTANNPPEPKPK